VEPYVLRTPETWMTERMELARVQGREMETRVYIMLLRKRRAKSRTAVTELIRYLLSVDLQTQLRVG
jgi:hypothetical protein